MSITSKCTQTVTGKVTEKVTGAVVSSSTLTTGLLNWFELSESSGSSRECSHSSVSLAEASGSTGTRTGPDGNPALQFNGTGYLQDTSVDGAFFTDDDAERTDAVWIYLPSTQSADTIFFASGNAADNQEYRTQVVNNSIGQLIKNAGAFVHNVIVEGAPPFLKSASWFCLFFENTGTSRNTYYNDESSANASTAHTDTGAAPASSALYCGADNSGTKRNVSGVSIAKWARWNRVLTQAEREEYFNSGAGIAYPG